MSETVEGTEPELSKKEARQLKREQSKLGASAVPTDEWRKFHKVTPVADMGTIWLGILGAGVYIFFDLLESGLSNFFGDVVELITPGRLAIGIGVIVVLSLLMWGMGAIVWKFKSFAVIESGIHFRRGVIFKKYDHMRWDRIQSVEVEQRLFGRLFGFGSVKVEAAGFSEDALDLGLLTMKDCALLRKEILRGLDNARAGRPIREANPEVVGTEDEATSAELAMADAPVDAAVQAPGSGVPSAQAARSQATESFDEDDVPVFDPDDLESDIQIYELPTKRLLGSVILSGGFFYSVGLIIFLVVIALLTRDSEISLFIPMLFAFTTGVWPVIKNIFKSYAAKTFISENGLRSRSGLTKLVTRTLPPSRIHAVRVKQNLLWRRKDWWKIELTIAGTSVEDLLDAQAPVMPVGTVEETLRVLHTIFPTLGSDDDAALIHEAMKGYGDGRFMHAPPTSGKWLDPIARKGRGYHVNERVFVAREGRFSRTVDILFQDHTQSTTITQGPIQRKLGLATVRNDILLGASDARVDNFGLEEMKALLEKQYELTKRARSVGVSESVEDWKARLFAPHA